MIALGLKLEGDCDCASRCTLRHPGLRPLLRGLRPPLASREQDHPPVRPSEKQANFRSVTSFDLFAVRGNVTDITWAPAAPRQSQLGRRLFANLAIGCHQITHLQRFRGLGREIPEDTRSIRLADGPAGQLRSIRVRGRRCRSRTPNRPALLGRLATYLLEDARVHCPRAAQPPPEHAHTGAYARGHLMDLWRAAPGQRGDDLAHAAPEVARRGFMRSCPSTSHWMRFHSTPLLPPSSDGSACGAPFSGALSCH